MGFVELSGLKDARDVFSELFKETGLTGGINVVLIWFNPLSSNILFGPVSSEKHDNGDVLCLFSAVRAPSVVTVCESSSGISTTNIYHIVRNAVTKIFLVGVDKYSSMIITVLYMDAIIISFSLRGLSQ